MSCQCQVHVLMCWSQPSSKLTLCWSIFLCDHRRSSQSYSATHENFVFKDFSSMLFLDRDYCIMLLYKGYVALFKCDRKTCGSQALLKSLHNTGQKEHCLVFETVMNVVYYRSPYIVAERLDPEIQDPTTAKFYLVVNALLSGQKNCLDNLFCPGCQCPRFFVFIISCPSGPWFVVLSPFCPYFCPVLISEIFYNFLGILWAQIITTCIIKLLSKVPDIPHKMSSLKGWGDYVWR